MAFFIRHSQNMLPHTGTGLLFPKVYNLHITANTRGE